MTNENDAITLENVLYDTIDAQIADLNIVNVATVQTFKIINRQPVISAKMDVKRRMRDDSFLTMPIVEGIRVVYPGNKNYSMTWPLAKGDTVLLLCSDRSLDEWKSSVSGDVEPASVRKFDLQDAVAIPFPKNLNANQVVLQTAMRIGENSAAGFAIEIADGKIKLGTQAAELMTLFNDLLTQLLSAPNIIVNVPGAVAQFNPTVALLMTSIQTKLQSITKV